MNAMAWRRTLLFLLVVASQGILAEHDAQHLDAQASTCSVCQAHLPQIAGEASGIVFVRPVHADVVCAPHSILSACAHRPRAPFQSRAPPGNLS